MTDKEFLDFVGENEDSLVYLENRNKSLLAKLKDKFFKKSDSKKSKEIADNSVKESKEDATTVVSADHEDGNASLEKIQLNNNSGNPFED